MERLSTRAPQRRRPNPLAAALRMIVLLLPSVLLSVAAARAHGDSETMLWLGAAFGTLAVVPDMVVRERRHQPLGVAAIAFYLIALAWLWSGSGSRQDWYPHVAQAILLLVPLGVLAVQTLETSGASAVRRANHLGQRLAARKQWPAELPACRDLPEARAFRDAVQVDATPALNLLLHKDQRVRYVAYTALEYRKAWQPGQSEAVLHAAQKETELLLRVAAAAALANVEDRLVIEGLAGQLTDPDAAVRRATIEALFWDVEHRWPWIRHAVRELLGNPNFLEDGPLQFPYESQLLPPEAVADLTAWASGKGVVGLRAAQTLRAHYERVLADHGSDALAHELRRQVMDPHTAAPLRIELARLLHGEGGWGDAALEELLDTANPAPLRLVAAEALLATDRRDQARDALLDLARLPNREIALATAEIVQRQFGVDLGLAPDQPLPPVHTRQAAEVTRHLMAWATERAADLPRPAAIV